MSRPGCTPARTVCAALLFALVPFAASAQNESAAQTPRSQGPMKVERIESGFLIAPEFKVTRFDRRTSELAGFYGGWLADQAFFIGGGGYWLTNRSRDRGLGYGGVVLGVMPRSDRRVSFGVKGLLGGGRATRVEINIGGPQYDGPVTPQHVVNPPLPVEPNVRVREDFWIAEPEATVVVRFSRHVHLT